MVQLAQTIFSHSHTRLNVSTSTPGYKSSSNSADSKPLPSQYFPVMKVEPTTPRFKTYSDFIDPKPLSTSVLKEIKLSFGIFSLLNEESKNLEASLKKVIEFNKKRMDRFTGEDLKRFQQRDEDFKSIGQFFKENNTYEFCGFIGWGEGCIESRDFNIRPEDEFKSDDTKELRGYKQRLQSCKDKAIQDIKQSKDDLRRSGASAVEGFIWKDSEGNKHFQRIGSCQKLFRNERSNQPPNTVIATVRGDDFNFKAETYQCGDKSRSLNEITSKEKNDLMGLNQKTVNEVMAVTEYIDQQTYGTALNYLWGLELWAHSAEGDRAVHARKYTDTKKGEFHEYHVLFCNSKSKYKEYKDSFLVPDFNGKTFNDETINELIKFYEYLFRIKRTYEEQQIEFQKIQEARLKEELIKRQDVPVQQQRAGDVAFSIELEGASRGIASDQQQVQSQDPRNVHNQDDSAITEVSKEKQKVVSGITKPQQPTKGEQSSHPPSLLLFNPDGKNRIITMCKDINCSSSACIH